MVFSASISVALAAALLVLSRLGQQGDAAVHGEPRSRPRPPGPGRGAARACLHHEGAVMVDATLGLGGHTEAVLTRCELARVIGIDRDPEALALARQRLAGFGDRFTAVHAVYDELPDVLDELGLDAVDAVLFDLGVSSMQLDVRERGFAYAEDAPLDMRMDGTTGPTAADVLNTYSAKRAHPGPARLRRGAVRRKIAAAVVRQRESRRRSRRRRAWSSCCTPRSRPPRGVPAATPPSGPSRRSGWRSTTSSPCCAGRPRGHRRDPGRRPVVVESYHSLEDRLVKQAFTAVTRSLAPPDLPHRPAGAGAGLPARHPRRRAGRRRRDRHQPRAASVRLRAVERIKRGAA